MKIRILAALVSVLMTALTFWAFDYVLVQLNLPCPHGDARVCVIDDKLRRLGSGHRVSYKIHREQGSRVYAHTQWVINGMDVVHLQPTERWSDAELFYVMAHEYAHSLKRHSRVLLESVAPVYWRTWSDQALYARLSYVIEADDEPVPQAVKHAVELEADAFAVKAMLVNHVPVASGMRGVLGADAGGVRHPSAAVRYREAEMVEAELAPQLAMLAVR